MAVCNSDNARMKLLTNTVMLKSSGISQQTLKKSVLHATISIKPRRYDLRRHRGTLRKKN